MDKDQKKQILKEAKKNVGDALYKKAFFDLLEISKPSDDFVDQIKYSEILGSIPQEELDLKNIKIAILASSTVTHFIDILKFWLAKSGFVAEVFEAEYGTVNQAILDPKSRLYAFKPDIAVLFTNYRDVIFNIAPGSHSDETHKAVASAVDTFDNLWTVLLKNLPCHIIQNNADLPYHRVLGNYEGVAEWGHLNFLRSFNLELAKAAQKQGVTIFDIDHISSAYGKRKWHETRYWYHSKHAFSPDATGLVAYDMSRIIGCVKGHSKKCLILDLDNTIWGGVIGDDGLDGIAIGGGPEGEAFVDFQKYLLEIKRRGIMLAACSKNDETTAKEPFIYHPQMLIKLEDFSLFKANWQDKVSNIKEIAAGLNIGLDSIVFVDDNPLEREFVRRSLPMVSVPELPLDPVDYVATLSSYNYFETVSFSPEDKARGEYYHGNIERVQFQKQCVNLDEYLQNLQMEVVYGNLDGFNLPRFVQLINKTNQFNLTTIRYTEAQIRAMMDGGEHTCLYFRLSDRFGDNGLISGVILRKQGPSEILIDSWIMSCRVLSRGVEEFVIQEIVLFTLNKGYKKVIGQFIPTKKNGIVSDLYEKLGFSYSKKIKNASVWELNLDNNTPRYKTFIKKSNSEACAEGVILK